MIYAFIICGLFIVGFLGGVFVVIKELDKKDGIIKKMGMENQTLKERHCGLAAGK